MRAGACKLLGFLGMREGQGMRVRSARHSHIPYLLGWKVQGWGWDEFLEKAKSEWHTLPSGSRENMLESFFSIVSCSGSLPLSPELLPKADARGSCGTHLGRNYPNPCIQGPLASWDRKSASVDRVRPGRHPFVLCPGNRRAAPLILGQ